MYKNRYRGKNNLCGAQLRRLRKSQSDRPSQRQVAFELNVLGLELTKNTIQRIEQGERFVSDIELKTFARYFGVPVEELLRPLASWEIDYYD